MHKRVLPTGVAIDYTSAENSDDGIHAPHSTAMIMKAIPKWQSQLLVPQTLMARYRADPSLAICRHTTLAENVPASRIPVASFNMESTHAHSGDRSNEAFPERTSIRLSGLIEQFVPLRRGRVRTTGHETCLALRSVATYRHAVRRLGRCWSQ